MSNAMLVFSDGKALRLNVRADELFAPHGERGQRLANTPGNPNNWALESSAPVRPAVWTLQTEMTGLSPAAARQKTYELERRARSAVVFWDADARTTPLRGALVLNRSRGRLQDAWGATLELAPSGPAKASFADRLSGLAVGDYVSYTNKAHTVNVLSEHSEGTVLVGGALTDERGGVLAQSDIYSMTVDSDGVSAVVNGQTLRVDTLLLRGDLFAVALSYDLRKRMHASLTVVTVLESVYDSQRMNRIAPGALTSVTVGNANMVTALASTDAVVLPYSPFYGQPPAQAARTAHLLDVLTRDLDLLEAVGSGSVPTLTLSVSARVQQVEPGQSFVLDAEIGGNIDPQDVALSTNVPSRLELLGVERSASDQRWFMLTYRVREDVQSGTVILNVSAVSGNLEAVDSVAVQIQASDRQQNRAFDSGFSEGFG